jgi:hypothetical protein
VGSRRNLIERACFQDQIKKPFPNGNGFLDQTPEGDANVPYTGITQIRFDGFNLRLFSHPEPQIIFRYKIFQKAVSRIIQ